MGHTSSATPRTDVVIPEGYRPRDKEHQNTFSYSATRAVTVVALPDGDISFLYRDEAGGVNQTSAGNEIWTLTYIVDE